jgi:putative protease
VTRVRPEILAPAGDRPALEAAVAAGADAVYFGLARFSARARATNIPDRELEDTLDYLHGHGVKGYVALNTLVFDRELAEVEQAIRRCAAAGVDALIVQDLGVARLARAVAPSLPLHASTQMTCTDAGAVELARSLGASRVILARELSLDDIAAIRRSTDVELEVFVHGALCIAYSGQCLTSEAIGGRSANRGACAQACRLPYDLLVDGQPRDLGDRAYLLSPEDLEASALVPRLIELGVCSLKIEGRMKGPDYVAATTRLYREAVAAAVGEGAAPALATRQTALQMYSRGSGPGFLSGIDHQRLVDGRTCEHRGVRIGSATGVLKRQGRRYLRARLTTPVARGDGVVVAGGREGAGEIGGRVWDVVAGREALLWLGPDVALPAGEGQGADDIWPRALHRTSDPEATRQVQAALRQPVTVALDVRVRGQAGAPAVIEARTARGHVGEVATDVSLAPAPGAELTEAICRAQLGRLGGSPFHLGRLQLDLPPGLGLPVSALNRARRALLQRLSGSNQRSIATTATDHFQLLARAHKPDRPPPPPGLFVLCRNQVQAEAALAAGADGVYLDILELTGTGIAFRALTAAGAGSFVGLAPPRIRKPGEEKIDHYLGGLGAPGLLVRGLGALHELEARRRSQADLLAIGDFSLNVTNRLTAAEVLARGLDAFTPAYDLDAGQLAELLSSTESFGGAGGLAPWAELVVHHPMPLFHMEHCVFAALLSSGRDHRDCGRPCERHQVSLRDRAGLVHPLEADVGCRNTVFHASSQSAAELIPGLQRQGVRRFRIELVRESAAAVGALVGAYRQLLSGQLTAGALWRQLQQPGAPGAGYGVSRVAPPVVRGSLRVLNQ